MISCWWWRNFSLFSSKSITPSKTNMDPKNEGLVQMFLLFKWVIFRFQPFVFRGIKWQLHPCKKKRSFHPCKPWVEPPTFRTDAWWAMSLRITGFQRLCTEWMNGFPPPDFFPFWSQKLVVWVDGSPLDQRGIFRFHASFPGCTLIYHDLHHPSSQPVQVSHLWELLTHRWNHHRPSGHSNSCVFCCRSNGKKPSWWLNSPPIWKICASQIGFHFPKVQGENSKIFETTT